MESELSAGLARPTGHVLDGPVVDAIGRARLAKLDAYRHVEPVILLKLNSVIRVIVRVGIAPPRHIRSTTNRFFVLDAKGTPLFTGNAITGLSTTAAMLRDTGWAKAETSAADAHTRRITIRFTRLLHQPTSFLNASVNLDAVLLRHAAPSGNENV